MALFSTLVFVLFAAAVVWRWPWETLQFLIVIAFAAAGLLAGSALNPGSRIAEGLVMIPFALLGLYVSGRATKTLSRLIDRRGGQDR